MARPTVKAERREQILDAYEACVARFGVEGASLEKVASMAGLARPLIRHNIGNREDLLAALVDRFLARSDRYIAALIASLPAPDDIGQLIDWLFDNNHSDPQFVLVAEALIAASQDDPALARRMRAWTRRFIATMKSTLQTAFPNASPARLNIVATGITGLYFNADSLSPLGAMKDVRNASRNAALLLVDTLK